MIDTVKEDRITEPKDEKPTLVIRQTDRDLAERIRKGENIYSVIASVLRDDSNTMAEYWERSLLAQDTISLPQDLLTLYGITEQEVTNLDFRAGFGLVEAHWYPAIVQAGTPSDTTTIADMTPITRNPRFADIMEGLGKEFAKGDAQAQDIREHLKTDPSGLSWLNKKMRLEAQSQPYLPLEKVGVEKAITGATRLHGQIQTALGTLNQQHGSPSSRG